MKTKTLATLEDVRSLAESAENLAPWMPTRIENIRGTVKRDDLTPREVQDCASNLRIDIRIATRRIAENKPPQHTDIMDAKGIRPRPYVGERVKVLQSKYGADVWGDRVMRIVKRDATDALLARPDVPVHEREGDVWITLGRLETL